MYCGIMPGLSDLTIDHVQPRSRGGTTSWTNCVTACVQCNSHKADRFAHSVGLSLRREPSVPHWPGGLDPRSLRERPVWHRFVPASTLNKVLGEVSA